LPTAIAVAGIENNVLRRIGLTALILFLGSNKAFCPQLSLLRAFSFFTLASELACKK